MATRSRVARPTSGDGAGVWGKLLIILAASIALGAWVVMLMSGAVYSEYDILAPIGYWPSAGIYVGLSFLVAALKPTTELSL